MISAWKRVLLVAAVSAVALPGVPSDAGTQAELPPVQACTEPNATKTLFAENLRNGKIGYGLRPGKAKIPGPTIQITEGDCLAVTLVNETNKKLSMHAHGVKYTTESDGTRHSGSCVRPNSSRTYVFNAVLPTARPDGTLNPGSAGYWHYHDHCLEGHHGTAGIRKGLYGAIIVRRAGDPTPDRAPFVVTMNNLTINNRKAPKTPTFEANLGERVEFVVIGHGEFFHTFHLHGHSWIDNRTGTLAATDGGAGSATIIDNKTVGPADSFGFQVIAGENVGAGAWMYHCHVQSHSDTGMNGFFVVRTEGGQRTAQTRQILKAWRAQGAGSEGHDHG